MTKPPNSGVRASECLPSHRTARTAHRDSGFWQKLVDCAVSFVHDRSLAGTVNWIAALIQLRANDYCL